MAEITIKLSTMVWVVILRGKIGSVPLISNKFTTDGRFRHGLVSCMRHLELLKVLDMKTSNSRHILQCSTTLLPYVKLVSQPPSLRCWFMFHLVWLSIKRNNCYREWYREFIFETRKIIGFYGNEGSLSRSSRCSRFSPS